MGVINLVGSVALRQRHAPRRQDFQRGRSWNRETSMRAIDPTRAINWLAGQHARFSQRFQPDAGANNIDDGIHRAHFMEVDFISRQAVNFALGGGKTIENRDGFFPGPC